jgi:SAM-dependent methyltransferase
MRQLTCPVCHIPPLSAPTTGSRLSCPSCMVSWTFLAETIDVPALYRDEVYAVVDNRKSIFERIIFSEARATLIQAKKIHPEANNLLDFGAGKGQFLAVAKSLGWKVLGIETETTRAAFGVEKYGVDLLVDYYNKGIISGGGYDLISLNHVLEHLPQPMVLLQELISHNLAPQGLLYIEVPRADSWQARIAGEAWMHWDIPKHLSHWTEEALVQQLQPMGLHKAGQRYFSVHLGVLGMLQALLSRVGYKENLILRLKKKKTISLLLLIGVFLPLAWGLEVLATGMGKSGIFGLYLRSNG